MERNPLLLRPLGLLGGFSALMAFLLAVRLAFDYRGHLGAAERLAAVQIGQAQALVGSELRRLAEPAQALLGTLASLWAAGRLTFDDPALPNALLRGPLQGHPHLTSVNFGDAAGNGYLLLRVGEQWKNRLKRAAEPGVVRWAELGPGPAEERVTEDDYDPRLRPWYQAAQGRAGVQWTGPYLFRTTRDPGLTASLALPANGAARDAVVGADIMLVDLANALAGVELPWARARVWVLTAGGAVVASSDPEVSREAFRAAAELPTLDAPGFGELRAAVAAFDRGGRREGAVFAAEGPAGPLLAAVGPLAGGIELRICLTVPRSSVLAAFERESWLTAGLFVAFAVLGSAAFAARYLVPLGRLTRRAPRLGEGSAWPIRLRRRGDEIGELARALQEADDRLVSQRRELAASERRYRRLFEDNPCPLWVQDRETGRFLAANPRALDQYGYRREEFLTLAFGDLDAGGDGTCEGPCRQRRRDGTVLDVELVRHDSHWEGRAAQLCLALDVTERRRLEEELRQAQKLETIGRLAGGVAHDFNNLLMIIGGRCELLQGTEGGRQGAVGAGLAEIQRAVDRAAALTGQLLAFGRRQVLQPRVVDLNAVVADTRAMLDRVIGEHIRLAFAAAPDLWPVRVDPAQIGQVVMNLVLNARDALPDGGTVALATENREVPRGGSVPPGAYAVFTVADRGVGMDAHTLARIFEPFFTTKGLGRGTGLGLATVHGIVNQSGGHIEVASRPRVGTTFRVYLPRVDAGPPAPAEPLARAASGAGRRALLVEDQSEVRATLREFLEGAGFSVVEAADPAAAMPLAAGVDLVVADVVMPGGSGAALVRGLRTERPELAAVLVSGYPRSDGDDLGGLGARTVFLAKPFGAEALARAAAAALGGGVTGDF